MAGEALLKGSGLRNMGEEVSVRWEPIFSEVWGVHIN